MMENDKNHSILKLAILLAIGLASYFFVWWIKRNTPVQDSSE